MPRVAMVLTILFVASPLTELGAGQERDLPALTLPVLAADTPKQCCRVCRKGKGLWERVHQPAAAVHQGAGLRVQPL
jgi:hypothetical protein